jgi:two-component system sensor histidine kinase BaeS
VYEQGLTLADGVDLTIGDFEQIEVAGDPDRLKQLMLNLVDNALRYTLPGGAVTLDLMRSGAEAVLRVHDDGPGIAAQHLPHIFDRFYRGDTLRSRGAGGTGLGLAICQWIAEAHGGALAVESTVGVGSTFTLTLPIQQSRASTSVTQLPAHA